MARKRREIKGVMTDGALTQRASSHPHSGRRPVAVAAHGKSVEARPAMSDPIGGRTSASATPGRTLYVLDLVVFLGPLADVDTAVEQHFDNLSHDVVVALRHLVQRS